MKKIIIIAATLLLLSCAVPKRTQQDDTLKRYEHLLSEGKITKTDYTALVRDYALLNSRP